MSYRRFPAHQVKIMFSRTNLAAILVCAIAFLYSCLRAYNASITCDEAHTYVVHSTSRLGEILTSAMDSPANNHILNTLLIKFVTNILGVSEWTVRLPSLLAHILYLIGIYKILNTFFVKRYLIPGILLLTFIPFVIEFFSMARGYSLGLGFMSLGVYQFLVYIKSDDSIARAKNIFSCAWLLALATLSHLAFLHVYISVLFVFFVTEFLHIQSVTAPPSCRLLIRQYWQGYFRCVLSSAIFLGAIYSQSLFVLLDKDQFNEGGTIGFWTDTINSLIRGVLYTESPLSPLFFQVIHIIIIFLVAIALLLVGQRLRKQHHLGEAERVLLGILVLLMVCCLVIVLQWNFFHIKYVTQRRAVYFLPLFLIFLLLLWKELLQSSRKLTRITATSFFMTLAILCMVQFIREANFDRFYVCPYDASTKSAIQNIKAFHNAGGSKQNVVSLGTHWIFISSINFYIKKDNLYWLKPSRLEDHDRGYDYYYFYGFGNPALKRYRLRRDSNLIEKYRLRVIREFPRTNTYLAVPGR